MKKVFLFFVLVFLSCSLSAQLKSRLVNIEYLPSKNCDLPVLVKINFEVLGFDQNTKIEIKNQNNVVSQFKIDVFSIKDNIYSYSFLSKLDEKNIKTISFINQKHQKTTPITVVSNSKL